MALSGYIPGTTTFLARTDIEDGRAVQLVSGSLTDPPEVEYATGLNVVGITDMEARAGQLISVVPLNTDGTFEIDAVIETEISVGTDLYVADDGTGRVTDKDTTFFLGQSLSDNVVTNQRISIGSIAGGTISVADAAAVSIADVGGYYSSSDVEGALQEIGAALSHRPVSETFPMLNSILLNTDSTPRDKANIGGVLASDSQFAVLVNDNSLANGLIMPRLNIGTGGDTIAYFGIALTPFYPLDASEPLSLDLIYDIQSGTYVVTGFLNILRNNLDSFQLTVGPVTLPLSSGSAFSTQQILSTDLEVTDTIQQLFLDVRFQNVTNPAALNGDIVGIRLNYKTPALS